MNTRTGSLDHVESILSDRSFSVPEAPAGPTGIAWLRATASRFANGIVHAQRRQLVEAELSKLDPILLRAGARERTRTLLDEAIGEIEVMSAIARRVPLAELSLALGVPNDRIDEAVGASVAIGPAYLSGVNDEGADAAVEGLRRVLDRGGDAETAAAIAVLAQACEATAALIGTALAAALDEPSLPSEARVLVDVTLRCHTPLRVMRRVSPHGESVTLDLDAASRDLAAGAHPLAFGRGPRCCPGEEHAIALAEGILDALLPRIAGPYEVVWADHPTLRLPASLCAVLE